MSDKSGESLEHPNQINVMIVDDIMETRRSTRLLLTLIPEVKVIATAKDGYEAIEMAREHNPDIVLMDINMPQLDGVAAIKEILQHQPGVGCIVISAQRDSDTLRRAMAAGAKGYLVKPVTSDELAESIRRVAKLIQEEPSSEMDSSIKEHERLVYLQQLAMELIKSRRTDEEALAVFEELAAYPNCPFPWVQSLAVIYVFRQDWEKLQGLAHRLDQAP